MLTLAGWERSLWIASVAATAVLLAKLLRNRLALRYRSFSAYLGFGILSAVVLGAVKRATNLYAYIYFAFEFVFWVLQILILFELFGLVLNRYPGVQTLGRRVLKTSLALAVAIALLSMLFKPGVPAETPVLGVAFQSLYLLDQVVSASVLTFLCLMVGFLLWFPVPLSFNAARYAFGFTIYFAAKTFALFAINMEGVGWAQGASILFLALSSGCMIYWIATLTQVGEDAIVSVVSNGNPERYARLLGQIESINTSLLRSRRK